jgi:hypothetical protein
MPQTLDPKEIVMSENFDIIVGNREQGTGNREWGTGEQGTGSGELITDN